MLRAPLSAPVGSRWILAVTMRFSRATGGWTWGMRVLDAPWAVVFALDFFGDANG